MKHSLGLMLILLALGACELGDLERVARREAKKQIRKQLKPKPIAPAKAPAAQQPQQDGGGNQVIATFREAKRAIRKIFSDHRRTFYCGCEFSKRGEIDFKSCGYQVRANPKRARRMEVEHVVPAHAFGQSFPAWRAGHPDCVNARGKPYRGRRCAQKVSELFRRMEADAYNLQPAVGEVNADRSNYSMAEIPGELREYGDCDVEIDKRKIEPKPSIRGDIARTYFYMDQAYPGRGIVGKQRRRLFEAWAKADPVDDWERERVRRVLGIQGNENPQVK